MLAVGDFVKISAVIRQCIGMLRKLLLMLGVENNFNIFVLRYFNVYVFLEAVRSCSFLLA